VSGPSEAGPFIHVHRVGFDEVDAAGVVYFARFLSFCHDAIAAMLAPLEGGYAGLVQKRRLGLPAVHLEADFEAPLRFGDEVRIATTVERLGTSSCTFSFDLARAADGTRVARVRHVVALTDLDAMRARPLPDDLRRLLEARRA
jgi:4-hydroxybenzoyl-CoA thioesterase